MPDGKTIVADGIVEPEGDLNYRDSDIYAIDVATGATRAHPGAGRWTNPVVSPDGPRIAFAGYPFAKQTYHTEDLYVMRTDGSGARLHVRRMGSATPRPCLGAGRQRGLRHRRGPRIAPAVLRVDGRRRPQRHHHRRPDDLAGLDLEDRGAAAIQGQRPRAATSGGSISRRPAVPRRPAHPRQRGPARRQKLGDVEEIWYTSTGNAKVQGWIVKPPGFDRGKKYPLILEIHGGPHGMYNVAFNYMFQNFAANGFVVLYTNPRGSTGYGSEFGNAIEHAYPGVDYDDLMAGVDAVVGRGYIDTTRMYVAGCSRRRRAFELGDRPHRPLRRGGGALSGDQLDELRRPDRRAALHLQLLRASRSGRIREHWLKQSSLMYVGKVKTPTRADDRRARPADADAAERGVLRGAQDARRAGGAAAVRERISRHRLEAVELHADAALHDELVRSLASCGERGDHGVGLDALVAPVTEGTARRS